MISIRVTQPLDAPPAAVWADLTDIVSHAEWMADAESITITSGAGEVGTTFECITRIGPFRTVDVMEVTERVEAAVLGVRHAGLVTGEGRFTLIPIPGGGTEMAWSERLSFPWHFGGRLGERIAAPLMKAIWQRNLRRLATRFPAGGSRPLSVDPPM